ncbi:LacI family DNA-binding transcriptional regulator [Aestuariivirga sp.]|uniref:LacI family DNA-binding transcriptional regulator n=1 Tax=Aestuariivirga sp. TaxID=2650926 RepID=UPI003592EFA8
MNLRELSAQLGLSQTTVSRALNGFPEVSEETRARVRAAAELHGYRPSAAARRLATGQSGTLGLVFPGERNMLGDLLFTEFLRGCVEKASELSYDITLAMAHGSQSEEAVYRRAVRNARVDAMILSSPLSEDPRPALLRQLGMPFIVHGRTSGVEPIGFLDIDNEGAFFSAAKLMADLGHRRVALLNGERHLNFAADRERGFRQGLSSRGVKAADDLFVVGPMVEQEGLRAASGLLDLPPAQRPTGFVCSSIGLALGVKRACSKRGLVIGRDVALIAHDDRLHDMGAENFDPPLTATQSSIGEAGRRVVELCIGMLRAPGDPMPAEIWPVDLVVRSSTMPAL